MEKEKKIWKISIRKKIRKVVPTTCCTTLFQPKDFLEGQKPSKSLVLVVLYALLLYVLSNIIPWLIVWLLIGDALITEQGFTGSTTLHFTIKKKSGNERKISDDLNHNFFMLMYCYAYVVHVNGPPILRSQFLKVPFSSERIPQHMWNL